MTRSRLTAYLTLLVLLLQAALLVTFALDPSQPPTASSFFQALWALGHKPSFYPLVALLVIGPWATWLALSGRGGHRRVVLASWLLFLPLALVLHGHRIAVMMKVLWLHG
jgi:hypothetical protein